MTCRPTAAGKNVPGTIFKSGGIDFCGKLIGADRDTDWREHIEDKGKGGESRWEMGVSGGREA